MGNIEFIFIQDGSEHTPGRWIWEKQIKLINIGAKVVSHARLYVFMLMIVTLQQKLILAEPFETVFEFHTIEVQVVSDNELGDPNESHNAGGNQPITPAGLPDLIITETTIEETACNTYKLCYSMRNASSSSVGALVDNFIYIDGVHKFSDINLFPLLPNSTLYSCGTFTLPGTECSHEHRLLNTNFNGYQLF